MLRILISKNNLLENLKLILNGINKAKGNKIDLSMVDNQRLASHLDLFLLLLLLTFLFFVIRRIILILNSLSISISITYINLVLKYIRQRLSLEPGDSDPFNNAPLYPTGGLSRIFRPLQNIDYVIRSLLYLTVQALLVCHAG